MNGYGPWYLLLLLCLSLKVSSQQSDTTVQYFSTPTEELLSIKKTSLKTDTSLDNLHNYSQTGVLGNTGLPSYSLLATESVSSNFFKWMNTNTDNEQFTDAGPVYFYPGKIYTKVTGIMGQKQEQSFKLVHSQVIGKKLQVSVLFNRYSCFGFYNYQKTLTDNLIFSTNYTGNKGKWGYHSYFLFNKEKHQLNGGIKGDSLLLNKNIIDKQLLPVNLSTAKQNIRTLSFNFSAFYHLGKDTVSPGLGHFLVYEGAYQNNYWVYSDNATDSSWYKHTYIFPAGSHDSAISRTVSNSFLYKINLRGIESSSKFSFYGGYKNEWSHYTQDVVDTFAMNHIATAGLNFSKAGNNLLFTGQYVLAGYNKDNYKAHFDYMYSGYKTTFLSMRLDASRQMATMMSSQFITNHFTWSNNFSDISSQSGTFSIGSLKYKFVLGYFIQMQQHPVYFDTLALAKQYGSSTSVTRLFASKDLRLSHIHLNNTVNYQMTPNTDIIRLPQWNTMHQLYYEGKLFKKNLWLQAGVQACYISSFMANAYMPATNQFYLQNKTYYGDYVFIDLFINARIDQFSFFLKADHINQGFSGYNFMLCPQYPYPDRSFKAGLVWFFFD